MGNFVNEFFQKETIHNFKVDKLENILKLISDDYFNIICKNYGLEAKDTELIELKNKILKEFKNNILEFDKKEHKSFNEFYKGEVDYSDEYVYLNLKKFTWLGYIFLFTTNNGKFYTFKMPDEIIEMYEEMMRSS